MKVVLSSGGPSTIPLRETVPSGLKNQSPGLIFCRSTKQSSAGRNREVRFAGYAAIFDRVDRGGDVVRRGAFARTIAKGTVVPLLSEHRPGAVVGRLQMLGEDRRGLRLIAKVRRGAVREGMGLSFGYRVRSSRGVKPRELLDVELIEVSLVKAPMQPGARVHRVES